MGLKQTKETIKKRVSKTRGLKRTEDFKEKMRKPKSKETKEKIRNSLLGVQHTDERRENISISQKKRWSNPEERRKQSERIKGNKISQETRDKISNALKGKPQSKIKCPHCNKEGGVTMYRWHFDNCKYKT